MCAPKNNKAQEKSDLNRFLFFMALETEKNKEKMFNELFFLGVIYGTLREPLDGADKKIIGASIFVQSDYRSSIKKRELNLRAQKLFEWNRGEKKNSSEFRSRAW